MSNYLHLMHRKILILLCLWTVLPLSAQEVYNSVMGVDSIWGMEMLMTSDGNLMVAGSRGGDIHLSGWNTNGDTLWTNSVPGDGILLFEGLSHFVKLSTGEVLVGGVASSLLLDEQGTVTQTIPIGGFDILEVGEDSLISYHGYDPTMLRLSDRYGAMIWETSVVRPPAYDQGGAYGILARYDTGVLLFLNLEADTGFFWRKNFVSKYDLDGTFLDSMTLATTTGAFDLFLGSIATLDGGGLTYALKGTGCTHLIKTDQAGDTTWTRFICWGQPGYPEYFRTHGVVQLENGHFVLSGYHDMDGNAMASFHLLELDENGVTVCLEPMDAPAHAYYSNSGLVVDPAGRIHAFLSHRENWDAVASTRMVGYEELCLITTINEPKEPDWSVHVTSTHILLRSDGAPRQYDIHDLSGRIIIGGTIMSNITAIGQDGLATGVYLVSVRDLHSGGRQVKRIVIDR